jgi:NitT/TauT family transport system ATP-binding protein
VSVRFPLPHGEILTALSDVSLDIQPGEFISVLGPSGCGKSTMLRLIAGLIKPSDGQAFQDGTEIRGPSKHVGVVFQDANLLPWKSIFENVCLPGLVQHLPKEQYEARARLLMAMVGLENFHDSYPHQLSGGMRQRAGIARGLLHDPGILLMDEPFGALDAMTREQMNLELMRIWEETGKTVLFITHSISEAIFLADRVVVMTPRPGKIAEIVDVDIPRPRDLGAMSTPAFGRIAEHIRGHFSGAQHE